jgi:tripartite-type tricarboxylate transporter receptor subunit TctC
MLNSTIFNNPVSILNRRQVIAASAAAVAAPGLLAQTAWPAKPVNLLVPFPAGGGTDAFARPLSAAFAKLTNQQLVINNVGGGGGTVGAASAAKQAADGYNLFMGAVHHTIAPSVYPKLAYDIEADFVPLLLVASVPQVVVVNPRKIPANNFKEFLDLLKRSPGKFNYGSAGSGTSHHLAGELFKQQTQSFITHIPYRGAGPSLQGLIAGDVEMMFDGLGSSAAHIKGGRIKALMVAGNRRNPAIPDVPSAAEVGMNDYNVNTWYGVWAPKGMPADLQDSAIDAIRKACQTPELRQVWANQGAEFANLEKGAFGGYVKLELAKWSKVVKAAGGIKPD